MVKLGLNQQLEANFLVMRSKHSGFVDESHGVFSISCNSEECAVCNIHVGPIPNQEVRF